MVLGPICSPAALLISKPCRARGIEVYLTRQMTPSEQFVHALAQQACLLLWTYPSPQGKEPGKELCDTLVACPPHAIVFSVKEVELKRDGGDLHVAVERWKRKAVKESVDQ